MAIDADVFMIGVSVFFLGLYLGVHIGWWIAQWQSAMREVTHGRER
jgi:hypothetical protein